MIQIRAVRDPLAAASDGEESSMSNPIVASVIHWLHLFAATTAIGGAVFMRMVMIPSADQLDSAEEGFHRTARRKMTVFVMHSVLLLFLTGFGNLIRALGSPAPQGYHAWLGIKLLLAMAVFVLAIMLVIPAEGLEKFQSKRKFWLVVNILLGAGVLLASARLRMFSEFPMQM